jgi:phosphatidylserine synthase 2
MSSQQQLRHRKGATNPAASPPSPLKGNSVVVSDPNTELHDHDLRTKSSTAVHPFLSENFIDALYQPHTASVLLVVIVTIVYFAFIKEDVTLSSEATVKKGIIAMISVFLVFAAVQFRDGIILRPHPAVWRVVQGVGLVYLLALTFLCFQSRDDARQLFTYLYPDLGKPLPERSYADSCDIYTPNDPESNFRNLRDTILDEFILAHVIGYIGKAILFRDMKLCWTLSLFFELMEITFQHWLENFKECWWDHIIVDVLVCNNLGIILGLYICDYLNMKKYPLWIGVSDIPTTKGKIVRIIEQFTPFNWTSYNWEMFESPKRFFYSIGIVLAMNLVDLNAFFLKYLLWIPPRNPLNTYRLILWFFVGMPAIREYYQFVSDPECKRLGANTWIAAGIIALEVLLCIKFSTGEFHQPFPNHIWVPWLVFGILFSLWFIGFFMVPKEKRQKNASYRLALNVLLTLAIVPLVAMFFIGCPDLRWGQEWFDSTIDNLLVSFR